MAYFKWRGIDLTGTVRSGKTFARSENDLNSQLIDREIAMLLCFPARPWLYTRSINLSVKINFFSQLSVLLQAGVLLPEALNILGDLISNVRLREVICSILADVQEGLPLSEALKKHPDIFDSLMVRMVRIGQESGTLGRAIQQLGDYLATTQSFRKKLKSAALLPLMTFAFFGIVVSVVFTVIIPRFADIFMSMNKDLPYVTTLVINMSALFRGRTILIFIIGLMFLIIMLRQCAKSARGKIIIDKIILRIPLFGDLVKNSSLVYFLHSVSLLIDSGVQLLKAMHISNKSIKNSVIRFHVAQLEKEVAAGNSLSQSINRMPGSLLGKDLVAMVKVGEESGALGFMLKKAAIIYQGKVDRSIAFFTTIFQPLLMVILGLLITLLVFAIYLPVFSLSDIVQ